MSRVEIAFGEINDEIRDVYLMIHILEGLLEDSEESEINWIRRAKCSLEDQVQNKCYGKQKQQIRRRKEKIIITCFKNRCRMIGNYGDIISNVSMKGLRLIKEMAGTETKNKISRKITFVLYQGF